MASEINSPARPAMTASARQAAKVKGYVNQQLEKTRKQVKTIDFISGRFGVSSLYDWILVVCGDGRRLDLANVSIGTLGIFVHLAW